MVNIGSELMIKNLLPKTLRDRAYWEKTKLNIRQQDYSVTPPVFVLQFGKVGSTTIVNMLKDSELINPSHRVHYLSDSWLEKAEAWQKSNIYGTPDLENVPLAVSLRPEHLNDAEKVKAKKYFSSGAADLLNDNIKLGRVINRKVAKNKDANYKLITIVRDPVAREISGLFHNLGFLKDHHPLNHENGDLNIERVTSYLMDVFCNFTPKLDYLYEWFNEEIKEIFGVDIYSKSFDHNKGYHLIRHDNIELLAIKLENYDQHLVPAMSEFFDVEQITFELKHKNKAERRKNHEAYKQLTGNLVLPSEICEKIYSSQFCKYFFSKQERDILINKWSKK